jgi:hypothetical protein
MTDFYHLGHVPKHLNGLEIGNLNEGLKPLKNKSILIELCQESLTQLERLKEDYFENCVFIYHFEESSSNENWFKVFNNFKPLILTNSNLITTQELELSLEELRRVDQQINFDKMLEDSEAQDISSELKELKDLKTQNDKADRALRRAKLVNFEEELNLKALEVIFDAQSIGEIEDKLLEILRDSLYLKWLRILISPADHFQELPIIKYQKMYQIKTYNLDYDQRKKGVVVFAFEPNHKVKINTGLLLQRLSDALSLRIRQLSVEGEIETTSHQWETTFKALPFKAALVDKKYNVIQAGGEFSELKVTGPCYKTFFNKDKPCQGCRLGESFLIDKKNESLEVNSKEIFDPVEDDYYYLNFYRDFEVSTLTESRKATKSKLEELGIISGSIAHELNNPLGGIKILLELLEDEKEVSESEAKEDLKILKESTESCIHTVQELLSFTRPRKDTNPLEKTLEAFFNQLKTFTQAHLRSEGFVLTKAESPLFKKVLSSPDATLPIKLLESLSQFAKEQNRTQETQSIYFTPQIKSSGHLELHFSLAPLEISASNAFIENTFQEPLSLGQLDTRFNENNSCLTLNFVLKVKPGGTHV